MTRLPSHSHILLALAALASGCDCHGARMFVGGLTGGAGPPAKSATPAPTPIPPPPEAMTRWRGDGLDLRPSLGQLVDVVGVARRGKKQGELHLARGILDVGYLEPWPDALVGASVLITGILDGEVHGRPTRLGETRVFKSYRVDALSWKRLGDVDADGEALNPSASEGEKITLRGRACDTSSGAVVTQVDLSAVRIEGLERWPRELYGTRVEVRGTIRAAVGTEERPAYVSHSIHGAKWWRIPDVGDMAGARSLDSAYNPASQLGERLTLQGTAKDTKAGALLSMPAGGYRIYELKRWPANVPGTRVEVEATLFAHPPSPRPWEHGAGIQSVTFWLHDASWSQVK